MDDRKKNRGSRRSGEEEKENSGLLEGQRM